MLFLAFLAGAGAHYAALRTDVVGQSDPGLLPPLDPEKGWPPLDSARVVAIAKAAYKSEFYNVDSLVIDSLHYGRVGHTLWLSEELQGLGGAARIRVSNAGGACVLDFDQ
jgi:hypothetical protein